MFSLLGTTYGGDGQSTFALPDMQGNAAMQPGQGQGLSLRDLGEMSGVENVTLLISEMPAHTHSLQAINSNATTADPSNAVLSRGRYETGTQNGAIAYLQYGRAELADALQHPRHHWRRPAAQQYAALSDAQLLHRLAGNFPAATVTTACAPAARPPDH